MSQAAALAASRLAELVGAEQVRNDPAALSPYQVDGLLPSAAVLPGSPEEIAEVLRFAAAEGLAVIPMGGRSKLGIGMPPRKYDVALDVSRMNRVLAYEPGDLTLGVEPGVRFAELSKQLAGERQLLPLGSPFAERATMGGIVAAGSDSPLRYGYGGMRDYVLGMEFVTGAGTVSKSGGRVVKNVTGYDLHKLLIGSLGTLAVITRINFRTFPVAPEQRTFLTAFEDSQPGLEAALEFCKRLAESQLQLRMLEVFSAGTARLLAEGFLGVGEARCPARSWCVAANAAGHPAAVERHRRELEDMAREARRCEFYTLADAESDALLGALREFPRLAMGQFPGAAILRVAALPTETAGFLQTIAQAAERNGLAQATLVRAAGVLYAALLPPAGDAEGLARVVSACRELMAACVGMGARPTIEWCAMEVKRAMSVWPPADSGQKIAERLKNVFDPQGILAPGRMDADILSGGL